MKTSLIAIVTALSLGAGVTTAFAADTVGSTQQCVRLSEIRESPVIDDKTIVPGETYLCPELVGQSLEPGGFISTIASAATALTFRVSGREIT